MAVNIYSTSSNTLLSGTSGNDSIVNYGWYATINAGKGNDSIDNHSSKATISGGKGHDTIRNYGGWYATINAGAGNDLISNSGGYVTINGGAGNDSIKNYDGDNVTISGGAGNDKISLDSAAKNTVIKYASGDGNDTIRGFNKDDTLHITKGKFTTVVSGNDFIVNVDTGKIILKNALADKSNSISIKDSSGKVTTYNDWKVWNGSIERNITSNVTLAGSDEDDTIGNYAEKVLITGQAGNDYVYSNYSNVTIDGGAGNDYIINGLGGWYATINAGANNDYIENGGRYATINAGAGNDSIYNGGSYVTISAGAGNDSIHNGGSYVTISGGKGNDKISFGSYANKNVITYASGDGIDIVYGFNDDDTLKITKGSYATSVSGDDVIVTVGDGSITLKNATNKNISIADSKGKVTTKTFASSALFEEENNFSELDMIVEKDFELSDIQAETTQIISPSKSATPNLILSPAR